MAEPMAVEPSSGAPAEVTYALRVCDGVRLVIEARWHAGGEAFDVQVTDGASVWRKDGAPRCKELHACRSSLCFAARRGDCAEAGAER
jgi:hypothetical protein